jgi:hypothetical protein
MESHDEERMMYRNLQSGGSSGGYNVRNLDTALDRAKAAASIFFTIPGPKMIWQFGELGYDVSINFDGRVSPKPVKWEYYDDDSRHKLMETFAALIRLKTNYDVFSTSDFTLQSASLVKQLLLKNTPYTDTPETADDMNVVVVVNFNLTAQEAVVNYPHAGNWFQYFSQDDTLKVNSLQQSMSLQPGEFRIYTDVKLDPTASELNPFVSPLRPTLLSVTEANSQITLTWADHSSIETGYRVYRKMAGGSYALIATLAKGQTTYNDNTGLLPEKTYTYYVEAFNATGATASDVMEILTSDLITDNEKGMNLDIVLYPNPVDNILTITAAGEVVQQIKVVDLRGVSHQLTRISNETWDLQDISKGLYVVEIKTQRGFVRKKIIKE